MDTALPHERELAQFLAVHHGQGPGILWPEQDRPDPPDLTEEARRLARLTGLPVEINRHRAATQGRNPRSAGSPTHLLVHQAAGAASWHLQAGAETLRCRLRTGEVLYIPQGWAWQATLTEDAHLLVTRLAPATAPPPSTTTNQVGHQGLEP